MPRSSGPSSPSRSCRRGSTRRSGAAASRSPIVGMGCRFPGAADSPEAFWQLLRDGATRSARCPPTAGTSTRYFDADPDAPGQDVHAQRRLPRRASTGSTPQFFGISPREAHDHGPAAAAAARGRLGGARARRDRRRIGCRATPTGVFVGISSSDYRRVVQAARRSARGSTRTSRRASPTASPPAGCPTCSACRGRAIVDRHGLLVVAGRGASGRARACAPASADMALAGGVNLILLAGDRRSPSRKRTDAGAGRPLQDVRRRGRRLRARRGLRRRGAQAAGRRAGAMAIASWP